MWLRHGNTKGQNIEIAQDTDWQKREKRETEREVASFACVKAEAERSRD
jgi:hypothetical protein